MESNDNREYAANAALLCEHIKKYCGDLSCSPIDVRDFSCLDDTHNKNALKKVRFNSIKEIPVCTKYNKPSSIQMLDFRSPLDGCDMVIVKFKIKALLEADEEHFLELDPRRYDAVKRSLSEGFLYYPMVYFERAYPKVFGGRHRLIALYKYGFSFVYCTTRRCDQAKIAAFQELTNRADQ